MRFNISSGVLYFFLFLLIGCTHSSVGDSMRGAESFAQATATPEVSRTRENGGEVMPIGVFSNKRTDGEHDWGVSFYIWRHGDQIVGLVTGDPVMSLMGDPPTSLLENVRFDASSRKFAFSSHVLRVTEIDRSGKETEKWAIYEFNGSLGSKTVSGELKITEISCTKFCTQVDKISLRRSVDRSKGLGTYKDIFDWKTQVTEHYRIPIFHAE